MWSRQRILQRPLSAPIRRILRIEKSDQAVVDLRRMRNRAHMSHRGQHFVARKRQRRMQHVCESTRHSDGARAA